MITETKQIVTKDNVEQFIKKLDYVSFANLQQEFPEEGQPREYEIGLPKLNAVYWWNITETMIKVLNSLMDEGKIHMHTSSRLVYMIDGQIINLPIATRKPKGGSYKTQHWIPVTFRPGAICNNKKECLGKIKNENQPLQENPGPR